MKVSDDPDRRLMTDDQIMNTIASLRTQLNGVLVGKSDVIELVLTCLLARGHLLLEDEPGLGKTTLAKAVAKAIHGRFSRIQCTPDLMPSDVTGFNMFNPKSREFEFRRGPVFCDILLADEINRATPRAQSSLFEAMAERQVTIDDSSYELSRSFFVIATQNPFDSHGAYPLPRAQLDRFAMKLHIGYPAPKDELALLEAAVASPNNNERSSESVTDLGTLELMQRRVSEVEVSDAVRSYLLALGQRTRNDSRFSYGISPRGMLTWQSLAQAHAFLDQRWFTTPQDIQAVAKSTLTVRLESNTATVAELVDELLRSENVPVN